jgi:hypothetical protein
MLHALPFSTFGEAAMLGLEADVYCPSCFRTWPLDPAADRLRDRCFARTRFRCTNVRWTGKTCGSPGMVTFQPPELLSVGGDVRLAFLWCDRCLPPWQISYIPIDRPPWAFVDRRERGRFHCPGCRCAVRWHIHGPTWRPFPSDSQRGTDRQGTEDAGQSEPGDDVDAQR